MYAHKSDYDKMQKWDDIPAHSNLSGYRYGSVRVFNKESKPYLGDRSAITFYAIRMKVG